MKEPETDLGLRPDADPELVFWRTKALERAHVIHSLRLQNRNLRDALDEAEAENLRLRAENGRLVHQARLAYLEGLDQGRALREAC